MGISQVAFGGVIGFPFLGIVLFDEGLGFPDVGSSSVDGGKSGFSVSGSVFLSGSPLWGIFWGDFGDVASFSFSGSDMAESPGFPFVVIVVMTGGCAPDFGVSRNASAKSHVVAAAR